MNQVNEMLEKFGMLFPSPTGVKYYEFINPEYEAKHEFSEFPSPTGVKYYELR